MKKKKMNCLDRLRTSVDEEILRGIDPRNGTLEAAMHYALSIKGKRLRPLLFLTLLDAWGHRSLDSIDIAVAIEIIHTYSLIHDDLPSMDNDDLRRGLPTVHRKFGEAVALLAGDTLLTLAFEKIVRSPLPAEKKVRILSVISRSIGKDGMAGGQLLDLEFRGDAGRIEDIHRLKTAELIKATMLAAAEIADLAEPDRAILVEAGLSIGLGFQLADDLLDVIGSEEEVGKKINKDRLNQSPNAVLHWGMDKVKTRIVECHQRALESIRSLGLQYPPLDELLEKMVFRSK
jgi:geranylgeranyl diphosphate synthase type II